jgi:hypothetical protein
MKFIQIITGTYSSETGNNHAIYGLTEKGNVFKYERKKGWTPLKGNITRNEMEDVTSHIKSHSAVDRIQRRVTDSRSIRTHGDLLDDDVPF